VGPSSSSDFLEGRFRLALLDRERALVLLLERDLVDLDSEIIEASSSSVDLLRFEDFDLLRLERLDDLE
jgi:hypothetical protein